MVPPGDCVSRLVVVVEGCEKAQPSSAVRLPTLLSVEITPESNFVRTGTPGYCTGVRMVIAATQCGQCVAPIKIVTFYSS